MKAEKDQAHEDYHKNFKAMMLKARQEKAEADRLEKEALEAQKSFDEEGNEIEDKENAKENGWKEDTSKHPEEKMTGDGDKLIGRPVPENYPTE
jgi:hypothetical protein